MPERCEDGWEVANEVMEAECCSEATEEFMGSETCWMTARGSLDWAAVGDGMGPPADDGVDDAPEGPLLEGLRSTRKSVSCDSDYVPISSDDMHADLYSSWISARC